MNEEWIAAIEGCLTTPEDLQTQESFKLFKILYENTEAFLPGFANKIGETAMANAAEIRSKPNQLSDFHKNIFLFKVRKHNYLENKPK